MHFKKSLIVLALTSTLAACGSDSSTPDTVISATPVETNINGKGIKGVLTNAVVTVYKFVDGVPEALSDEELTNADLITDDKGNYSFTVLDYDGPIKVELSPRPADLDNPENNTTMTCDAPAGCGDTAFGDQIDLSTADSSFKLASISVVGSESNGEVKMNVSALTHLAAVLIEADDAGVSAESIAENSAQIASTFGIEGDITQLEPTVTDDASAVAAEDNAAELRYGLINAGIMTAIFSDDAAVLSSKLAEAAADLVENDGALLINEDEDEDFELALVEVLKGAAEAAQTASEAITENEELTSTLDLLQVQVNFANEQAYQEANVGDDGRAEVVVDVPTEGDAVAKAKAMVEDVRLFSHLFNDETTEGTGIKTQGAEYLALMDEAGTMIEAEAESFELLTQISNALTDLSMQYDEGTVSKEVAAAGINIASYIDGAIGTIIFDEETETGGILFKVDAAAGSEKIKLNVSAEFSEDNKSIKLAFDGIIESTGATFTLNEGSFAQVNFDTSASREALENDTYEGEIISGELDLALSLAQKATDSVPNPVTFEGMVKTKLLPIKKRVFDEYWQWDAQSNESIISYSHPELETVVLPETLSLSGAFSSLEGNLIKATLTVNINDLADYEAPDFKYIGREVADVLTYTVSDDFTTLDVVQSEQVNNSYNQNLVFTPSETAGYWSLNLTSDYTDENSADSKIQMFSRPFSVMGIDEPGLVISYAKVVNGEAVLLFSARYTPVDNSASNYDYEMVTQGNGEEYNIDMLFDNDGQLLRSDGSLALNDPNYTGNTSSVLPVFQSNPLEMSTGTELMTNYLTFNLDATPTVDIVDVGKVKAMALSEEMISALVSGNTSTASVSGFVVQPLIKDALTVTVSEDVNTVEVTTFKNFATESVVYEGTENLNFTVTTTRNNSESSITRANTEMTTISSKTTDIGLDNPKITLRRTYSYDYPNHGYDHHEAQQAVITPVDSNDDGLADSFNVDYYFGENFNESGVLFDQGSEVVIAHSQEGIATYNEILWGGEGLWHFADPLTINNALSMFKYDLEDHASIGMSGEGNYAIDGVGEIDFDLVGYGLEVDDFDEVTAGSTTTFDAYNTKADTRDSLENKETFLQGNAALTLEAILGDYQVKLQLSGERTALDDGVFDLGMSYRLPGDDVQRSFTVHYNTEEEGKLTANNFEGAVLVLEEPNDDVEGTQVIGQILIGPAAIVAATIEDRDGLIVIVYSDETTESL